MAFSCHYHILTQKSSGTFSLISVKMESRPLPPFGSTVWFQRRFKKKKRKTRETLLEFILLSYHSQLQRITTARSNFHIDDNEIIHPPPIANNHLTLPTPAPRPLLPNCSSPCAGPGGWKSNFLFLFRRHCLLHMRFPSQPFDLL